MINDLLERNLAEISEYCEDMDIPAICHYLKHDFSVFIERREAFLWVIKRSVEQGKIKLIGMKTDLPLEGTVEEQIERFRQAFPNSDEEMEDGLWFFYDACPAGCDWKRRFSKKYGTLVSE
jgi:hypothetical protein